ncbi:Hypothetical predicted protein, partial [Olea europaea subsp. europaea]
HHGRSSGSLGLAARLQAQVAARGRPGHQYRTARQIDICGRRSRKRAGLRGFGGDSRSPLRARGSATRAVQLARLRRRRRRKSARVAPPWPPRSSSAACMAG